MKSLELFDETLDINATENYELGIQAGPDSFVFCLLDTLRNKFVLIRANEPDENKYYNSENIKEFISSDDFLSRKYKKTRIIFPAPRFTTVPAPLFDPAKKDEYFRFNHKHESGEIILSNRNPDPELFVIYAVQQTFHSVISRFFPGIHPFIHIMSLLNHIAREKRSVHGNYIHVHIERDYFNLIIFQSGDLKFCNTFRHRNISDIMYFVLNVFDKLGIKPENAIHLSGLAEEYDDLTSNLQVYINSVRFSQPGGNFTFSYVFNDIELHRYLNLFNVFNCG